VGSDPYAICGSSGTDVYAVGSFDTRLITHYNGSSWSSVSNTASGVYNGVWGSSAGDVFVVGDSNGTDVFIRHFIGDAWSVSYSNTTPYLFAVWGSLTILISARVMVSQSTITNAG
jgi:hypothetical protein